MLSRIFVGFLDFPERYSDVSGKGLEKEVHVLRTSFAYICGLLMLIDQYSLAIRIATTEITILSRRFPIQIIGCLAGELPDLMQKGLL